jgi:polar amino acid transport system ATP-binding protein
MQPKVMLFDEVTSALDPELVSEVLAVVRQLAREGMTLIMVTHAPELAARCSRVVRLADGRIVGEGLQ